MSRASCACLAVLIAVPAYGDIDAAKRDFLARSYASAAAEFRRAAELGHPQSQFNLAAMYLNGQGLAKDPDEALAWMIVAVDNGSMDAAAELKSLLPQVTPAVKRRAAELITSFGKRALERELLPSRPVWALGASDASLGRMVEHPRRRFPALATVMPDKFRDQLEIHSGFLAMELLVAPDGSVRDVDLLMQYPEGASDIEHYQYAFGLLFGTAEPEAPVGWRNGLFTFSQFTDQDPGARRSLGAVAQQYQFCAQEASPQCQYALHMLSLSEASVIDTGEPLLLRAAQGGYAPAQHLVGRALAFGPGAELKKAQRWLELATSNGDANATVTLARLEIEKAPANWTGAAQILQPAAAGGNRRAVLALAALRIASPDPACRNDAIEDLVKRVHVAYAREPVFDEIRAAQAAAQGRFKRAVSLQEDAIERATELKWNLEPLERRLAAYRQNERWFGDLFAFQ